MSAFRKCSLWEHVEFLARWDQTWKLWLGEFKKIPFYFGKHENKLKWCFMANTIEKLHSYSQQFYGKMAFFKHKNREKLFIYKLLYVRIFSSMSNSPLFEGIWWCEANIFFSRKQNVSSKTPRWILKYVPEL